MTKRGGDGVGVMAAHLSFGSMLRKLAQRRSVLVAPGAAMAHDRMALMRAGEAHGTVVRADFDRARRLGLVEAVPGEAGWRLSAKGRVAVRRLTCSGHDRAEAVRDAEPATSQPGQNLDESPLAWLRRRRGKDGAALISDMQFMAGERLRADFTFAQLGPRVTANWDAALGASGGRRSGPGGGAEIADHVMAARERVASALKAVGPELAGILLDVCCFLKGIEDTERSVGWPQRSGKVVLQLALSALARHYGMGETRPQGTTHTRPRHWGAADYRPSIDGAAAAEQPAAD
jgi:hypothetical protein